MDLPTQTFHAPGRRFAGPGAPAFSVLALALAFVTAGVSASEARAAESAARAGAASAPGSTQTPASGRVREVVLDPQKRLEAPEIRLAPGLTSTLTFPEPWVSSPACGDCQYGDAPHQGQFWRLDIDAATNAISIKFIAMPTAAMLRTPPVTNVNLQLESGLYVSLLIVLTLEPKESDLRVDFRLPAGAASKERLTQKEKELSAGFDARVALAAQKELLKALAAGTRCRAFSQAPQRADGMVVRLEQLCSNGAYVYAVFTVENRGRTELSLRDATLTGDDGSTSEELRADESVPVMLFDKQVLPFNGIARGVAAIPLTTGIVPKTVYTLTVAEDGGKDRTVTVGGIEPTGGCSSSGGSAAPLFVGLAGLACRPRRRLRARAAAGHAAPGPGEGAAF